MERYFGAISPFIFFLFYLSLASISIHRFSIFKKGYADFLYRSPYFTV
jgi:hypothetical protein